MGGGHVAAPQSQSDRTGSGNIFPPPLLPISVYVLTNQAPECVTN